MEQAPRLLDEQAVTAQAIRLCYGGGQGRPMQTWIRVTLLAICTATGIGVALAVALRKPAETPHRKAVSIAIRSAEAVQSPPAAPIPPATNAAAPPLATVNPDSMPVVA